MKRSTVTPGLLTMLNILQGAILKTKRLKAHEFNEIVQVAHKDGSIHIIHSACRDVTDNGKHLIVYPEHGVPLVFNNDELLYVNVMKMDVQYLGIGVRYE